MRILLINPTSGPGLEYGALSTASGELPQLGIAYVANALKNANHHVRIVDCHIENFTINQILSLIEKGNYNVVGLSVYITTMFNSLKLLKSIKEAFSGVLTCVGGPQVTLCPSDFFITTIDYIFIGEADYSIVSFCEQIESGNYVFDIPGVICNKNNDFLNKKTLELVDNIDTIPLIDIEKFYDLKKFYPPVHIRGKKVINVASVRGCPYKCTFCAAAEVNGRRVRAMSPSRFVDQIEVYRSKGYDSFMIYDDTFTLNKKRAELICQEIIKRNLDIIWICWTRVDCLDQNILNSMRDSGCYLVMFGIESFNDHTLIRLKKGFSADQAIKGIEIAHSAGLLTSSSFMLGLPGESLVDMRNTIHQADKSNLDFALFPIFEPYKGTPIYSDCNKEGKWIPCKSSNLQPLNEDKVWVPNGIKLSDIDKMAGYAFRKFYLSSRGVLRFYNTFKNLPWSRRVRYIRAGLFYFVFDPIKKYIGFSNIHKFGSRYR